jgi:hypothetical protein
MTMFLVSSLTCGAGAYNFGRRAHLFVVVVDSYIGHLYNLASQPGCEGSRCKRQVGRPRCVRREYRRMSDDERNRFHAALNALKADTVKPTLMKIS